MEFLTRSTKNLYQGFSYFSEVGGQGPVEFGKKSISTIKIGKTLYSHSKWIKTHIRNKQL